MPLQIRCPHCRASLQIAESQQGKVIRCGSCQKTLTVPGEPAAAAPPPPVNVGRLDIGSATNRGRSRERNEDCFLVQHLAWSDLDICRETALVIVSDGLGGHQAGDQAARLVIRTVGGTMGELIANALTRQARTAVNALDERIQEAIVKANEVVIEQSKTQPGWRGMAATAAVVLVWNGQVVIGHVGDCRVYHYRDEKLTQVTKDQTLVARMVELGQLTAEEAENHPARNELTQAVGMRSRVEPASYQRWMKPGDSLIVSSDGLNAHVNDAMIADAVRKSGYSASLLANELVEMANRAGGTDNITVAAINCY